MASPKRVFCAPKCPKFGTSQVATRIEKPATSENEKNSQSEMK
jgi:hypothetical protein